MTKTLDLTSQFVADYEDLRRNHELVLTELHNVRTGHATEGNSESRDQPAAVNEETSAVKEQLRSTQAQLGRLQKRHRELSEQHNQTLADLHTRQTPSAAAGDDRHPSSAELDQLRRENDALRKKMQEFPDNWQQLLWEYREQRKQVDKLKKVYSALLAKNETLEQDIFLLRRQNK